jgi:Ser/Thr protein kinase RdoA (MazF antagonist)
MSARERGSYDAGTLLALAGGFAIPGTPTAVAPLGQGLINATFALDTGAGRYVLQRVNGQVFPHPRRIMANLSVLARHLARHPAPGIAIPVPIPRRDGADCVVDQDGHLWRLMERIPDAVNLPRVETQAQGQQVGFVLGRFHRLVADLDPGRLAVTLPGFHVTLGYLAQLDRVRADNPPSALDADLTHGLDEVQRRRGRAGALDEARRTGRIPLRVTHGDPKLDNILFHQWDGRALGLVDLDTVQPGLVQHDLGDCLRSCCNRQGESALPGVGVRFDLDICQAILGAYAGETRSLLGPAEVAGLYDGIRLIPFELGVRFLTDHLAGDRYFRVRTRGENLAKALTQFALTADIERREGAIRTLIRDAFAQP